MDGLNRPLNTPTLYKCDHNPEGLSVHRLTDNEDVSPVTGWRVRVVSYSEELNRVLFDMPNAASLEGLFATNSETFRKLFTRDRFPQTVTALAEWDLTSPDRAALLDRADTNEAVEAWAAIVLEAVANVQEAFYNDTYPHNQRATCAKVHPDDPWLRNLVKAQSTRGQNLPF